MRNFPTMFHTHFSFCDIFPPFFNDLNGFFPPFFHVFMFSRLVCVPLGWHSFLLVGVLQIVPQRPEKVRLTMPHHFSITFLVVVGLCASWSVFSACHALLGLLFASKSCWFAGSSPFVRFLLEHLVPLRTSTNPGSWRSRSTWSTTTSPKAQAHLPAAWQSYMQDAVGSLGLLGWVPSQFPASPQSPSGALPL